MTELDGIAPVNAKNVSLPLLSNKKQDLSIIIARDVSVNKGTLTSFRSTESIHECDTLLITALKIL